MANPTKVPDVINDGNWTLRQYESIEFEFPFSDKGDNSTFNAYAKYTIDKTAFRPLAVMSQAQFSLGVGYLTKAGDPRDIGGGLYLAVDKYSSVPLLRNEYGTFSFTAQFFESAASSKVNPDKYFYDVTWDIEEQTFTVPCQFTYEYFINTKPQPLLKSRVFLLFGQLRTIGGLPPAGGRLIADDSEISIYGARIFQRKTPYVDIQIGY